MTGIDFFEILMREPSRTVEHPPKSVLRDLVSGDLANGVDPRKIKLLLKELEVDEHFEACQGVKDALDKYAENPGHQATNP